MHLVDRFERALVREGKSPNTVRIYLYGVESLTRFCRERGVAGLDGITRQLLEDWQDSLMAKSARTRQLTHSGVRSFFRWAADHDLCDPRFERWIGKVKVKRLLPSPIPPADLDRLTRFLAVRRPRMPIHELRDRALFAYLVTTGARISEALQVTRAEFQRALVYQKGGSQKILMIPDEAAEYVQDYLNARADDCPWLWVSHSPLKPVGRLGPASVLAIWARLAERVGVRPFTSHQLRHTCATYLLAAGVREAVLATHLGHANLQTIMGYAEVREDQRQDAVDRVGSLLRPGSGPRIAERTSGGHHARKRL